MKMRRKELKGNTKLLRMQPYYLTTSKLLYFSTKHAYEVNYPICDSAIIWYVGEYHQCQVYILICNHNCSLCNINTNLIQYTLEQFVWLLGTTHMTGCLH